MTASFSGRCAQGISSLPATLPLRAITARQSRPFTGSRQSPLQAVTNLQGGSRRLLKAQASSDDSDSDFKQNTDFGYSRKDVLLIGAGFVALGYGLYYGAQAVGVEATAAGNYVQLFIFLIICVGYVSTYILRVANKDMTYTKQLEQYEQRVMQKRLEEMPETERERLMDEVEKERHRRGPKK